MKKKVYSGGSVFRSIFRPIPINTTAARVGGSTFPCVDKVQPEVCEPAVLDSKISSASNNPFASLPRIQRYKILIVNDGLTTKHLLLVRCHGVDNTPSHFLTQNPIQEIKVKDIFKTHEGAKKAGHFYKRLWGRKSLSCSVHSIEEEMSRWSD